MDNIRDNKVLQGSILMTFGVGGVLANVAAGGAPILSALGGIVCVGGAVRATSHTELYKKSNTLYHTDGESGEKLEIRLITKKDSLDASIFDLYLGTKTRGTTWNQYAIKGSQIQAGAHIGSKYDALIVPKSFKREDLQKLWEQAKGR